MTPEDARAISREINQQTRDRARATGGSWPGKIIGDPVNGFYRVEDAAGRQHRACFSAMGRLADSQGVTVLENSDGSKSIIANSGVEF